MMQAASSLSSVLVSALLQSRMLYVQCIYMYMYNVKKKHRYEKGNVLLFQLQFGTYLPTFRLDALVILRVEHLAETLEDKFQIEVERREHYLFHCL